jgi:hypothetical protein
MWWRFLLDRFLLQSSHLRRIDELTASSEGGSQYRFDSRTPSAALYGEVFSGVISLQEAVDW